MLLGLPQVLHGCFGVIERLRHALLDLDQGLLLPVGLHVDIFGDLVDAAHYAVDLLQLVLPLRDDLCHVVGLHLDLDAAWIMVKREVLTSPSSSWTTSSPLPHPRHDDYSGYTPRLLGVKFPTSKIRCCLLAWTSITLGRGSACAGCPGRLFRISHLGTEGSTGRQPAYLSSVTNIDRAGGTDRTC